MQYLACEPGGFFPAVASTSGVVWAKAEYAGELAVVSAWISALSSWYVSCASEIEGLEGSAAFL